MNLDMTDSMGPGKLVRHMQNLLYTYDEYLICIGLGPSISSDICKNLSYSGPSYPSSPVSLVVNDNRNITNVDHRLCNQQISLNSLCMTPSLGVYEKSCYDVSKDLCKQTSIYGIKRNTCLEFKA